MFSVPCHSAMIKELISASPSDLVEEVMALLKKHDIDAMPVIDAEGALLGVFSVQILLKNLLPVSVNMGEGISLDMRVSAAPGVAKRLKKVKPLSVGELMETKMSIVSPGAPLWEGLQLILTEGAPVFVVDEGSGALKGMITQQSMIEELERVQDE